MALVDREGEQRLVESFFDGAGPGSHALLLHGEAGIGKTTLWQAAIDVARRRGYRVITTRPTEAEARLPFAGLNDLFGELADLGRAVPPPPQQLALDVALMRVSVDGEPMQPLALPSPPPTRAAATGSDPMTGAGGSNYLAPVHLSRHAPPNLMRRGGQQGDQP